MTVTLETQEAGSGDWFAVVIYTPGTRAQEADANVKAMTLRNVGLYVRVTVTSPWNDAPIGQVWALTDLAGRERPHIRVVTGWRSFGRHNRIVPADNFTGGRLLWANEKGGLS